MEPKTMTETDPKNKSEQITLTSDQALDYAVNNSKMSRLGFLSLSIVVFLAALSTSYIARSRNSIAIIPKGDVWEYPMIHWMNLPTRYEEDAKPMHVALKYIRGLYEVEPLDFSEASTSPTTKVMLSHRIAELLAYTPPGTPEFLKVNEQLQRAEGLYQTYSKCKCIKRFLVSDMMVYQPAIPSLRVQIIGRFVIFGQDGLRPLDVEDMGLKSITLYLSNDIPIFDASEANGSGLKAENPEGWYVIKSFVSTISQRDLESLRQIRKETSMKGAL